MSQRIAELERAAGAPLVQRTTRSVRLTEAGARLVDASQGAFEGIARNLRRAMGAGHKNPIRTAHYRTLILQAQAEAQPAGDTN